MNCCGVVVSVAVVFDIVQNNEAQRICHARIRANGPCLETPTDSGMFAGNLRFIYVIQCVDY